MIDLDIMARLQEAMNKAVLVIEADAKRKCPVGTGELRNSITSRVYTDAGTVVGEVGSNLLYAPYVEYGTGLFSSQGTGRTDVPWHYKDAKGEWHTTSGMNPQPFLIPAMNENRTRVKEILKEAVRND